MDRRRKATLHRNEGPRLSRLWGVEVEQARFHGPGYWYAKLTRFPAALFDENGYVLFRTEQEYLSHPGLLIGKQVGIPKPGISALPEYIKIQEAEAPSFNDPDIHDDADDEGRRQLVVHLRRERSRSLAARKRRAAADLRCEVCAFSFELAYGSAAADYCEVHHLVPLAQAQSTTRTRLSDLAILCANCHRVVHRRNPPYTLAEVRDMLARSQRGGSSGQA